MIVGQRALVACDAGRWPGQDDCTEILFPSDTAFAVAAAMDAAGWVRTPDRDVCAAHAHLVGP